MHVNQLKFFPVSVKCITITGNIFGSNIAYLKLKTVRKVTAQVNRYYIHVLKKLLELNREVVMYFGMISVNVLPLVVILSQNQS